MLSLLIKREFFSWCGRLIGYVFVCGWFRSYCSFLKRLANKVCGFWDDVVFGFVLYFCNELREKFIVDGDFVRGLWYVDLF